MNITQSNFFSLLLGNKQYQIPIYQRNYTWTTLECKKLLEDIIACGTPGNPNHYVGSVIVKSEQGVGGLDIFNVIDGQQRTTTISLLLLALSEYYSGHNTFAVSQNVALLLSNVKNNYLVNTSFSQTSLFTKISLKSGSDRNEYDNLIHNVSGNGRISGNYQFFLREMQNRNINPQTVFDGINNAQIALVTLNAGENPQLLFEAVNDTGIDLTEVDKVRNWIFMGLSMTEQDRLYRAYWQTVENMLGQYLNNFLRYFIIVKTLRNIGNEYYKAFKTQFLLSIGNAQSVEDLLAEIQIYATIYNKYLESSFTPDSLNTQIELIKITRKDLFIPVILKIIRLCENNLINPADTIMMLRYIESYIVRRDILNIPTNSLTPAMINLLNGCDSLQNLIATISALSYRQRMPDNQELHTQLKTQNFYQLPFAYNYLERLEKSVNPAFALADPTIEHILPETMHDTANPKPGATRPDDYNWELDLGQDAKRIHDTYQHTLGNLTILPRGENSRMGDYRFDIKKNWTASGPDGFIYGYSHTPIRISQGLRTVTVWDETSILNRCDQLVNIICNVWPHP